MRSAIGETEFEMQQILGYAPIEPDGSFKLNVPADTPIAPGGDRRARAARFQTHTNWIQVRPGERRTCDGCHSPRRGGALNSGAIVNTVPAALQAGDGRRAPVRRDDGRHAHAPRPDGAARSCADMVSTDIWADTTQGRRHRAHGRSRCKLHRQRRTPADDLATAGADQRHHQLPDAHRSRCGRATAAPTPAPTATTIRPSST